MDASMAKEAMRLTRSCWGVVAMPATVSFEAWMIGTHFQYCGIIGKDGKLLLESSETEHEVRVMRSSKLPASSIYRRRKGFVLTVSTGPFPLSK